MMEKITELLVHTPQGLAGTLSKEARYVFNYEATDRKCMASLTMPLRAESYAGGAMPAPFQQNRPEGYLLQALEQRFAKFGGISDMQMLAYSTAQIGRLSFSQPGQVKSTSAPSIGRQALLKEKATAQLFDYLVETYLLDSVIAGVQPKVLIPDQDRQAVLTRATALHPTLIVKASGVDYPGLTQNEFLCMTAAEKAGLPVPPCWLSDDGNLFVIERFDVLPDGDHLGFEDFSVLLGRVGSTDAKYTGSYETIAKGIGLFCQDPAQQLESRQRLFDYIALSVLVRNGDAHLKNFGLLYSDPTDHASIRLSPLYDVVTTSMYDLQHYAGGAAIYDRQMALKLAASREFPDRATLLRFGREHCHVMRPEHVIERLCDALQDTLMHHGARMENPALRTALTKEWSEGMLSQQVKGLAVPRYMTAGKATSLSAVLPVADPWPNPDTAQLSTSVIRDAERESHNLGRIVAADDDYLYQHIGRETVKHPKAQIGKEQLIELAKAKNDIVSLVYHEGIITVQASL